MTLWHHCIVLSFCKSLIWSADSDFNQTVGVYKCDEVKGVMEDWVPASRLPYLYQPVRQVTGLLLQHLHLLSDQEVLSSQPLNQEKLGDARKTECGKTAWEKKEHSDFVRFIKYHALECFFNLEARQGKTYSDLHLIFGLLALHSQIFLLYFLHQFLVDGQTECWVEYRVLLGLKLIWHLMLKVLSGDIHQSVDCN